MKPPFILKRHKNALLGPLNNFMGRQPAAFCSNRCDADRCNCPYPQNPCPRPNFVYEVNCNHCPFANWKPCFNKKKAPKIEINYEKLKRPRVCFAGMQDCEFESTSDHRKDAAVCKKLNDPHAKPSDVRAICNYKAPPVPEPPPERIPDDRIPAPTWVVK